jgi:hypothetical protein
MNHDNDDDSLGQPEEKAAALGIYPGRHQAKVLCFLKCCIFLFVVLIPQNFILDLTSDVWSGFH